MGVISYSETEKLLSRHGIKIPLGRLARNRDEAIAFAKKAGFPLTIKVSSDNILHKTDVNGVILNIKKMSELEDAYYQMSKQFGQGINGFIIQKMYSGHSIIIGMKRDRQFGPVIAFGTGGIYVELIKDISYRIAPVSISEAESMIRETKTFPVLEGFRTGMKADIKKIAEMVSRVSLLAMKNKDIQEIDLNPVIVNEKEAVVVDARLVR